MKKAILATKIGMTQIFNEDGVLTPVTVLTAGPCVVTQVKTVENDGYSAVQVGFVDKREKLVNKPVKGHFDKAGVSYKRFVREFRFENSEEYSNGDEIKADVFAAGDKVKVSLRFRGREMAHVGISKQILDDFFAKLEDVAVIEKPAKMEGRSMIMFLGEKR